MRVLITGIAGFAGSHLAELALAQGAEVAGTVLPDAGAPNLEGLRPRVRLLPCDLRDPEAVEAALAEVKPERVFHLAGVSAVGASWARRAEALRANLETTLPLLEALRRRPVPTLVVSSGEVYGLVPEAAQPIRETEPVRPVTPYGVSKACVELAAGYYAGTEGLPLVVVRAFNHVGPRQAAGFLWSDVARQVAAIERGLAPPVLAIGATGTRRDFTDVRDMVRAYWLLLARAEPGEVYNAASGRALSVEEVVQGFLRLARCPIETRLDPAQLRPVDIPLLLGDAGRLRALTGWRPEVPLERSFRDVLEDWRQRL